MGVVRKTKAVKTLLQIMEQSPGALSAVKLIEQLRTQMNKTTIYRVLERLEEDGVVHSFIDKDGLKWYAKCEDGCTTHRHTDTHPHFQCKTCGKIECLEIEITIPKLADRRIDSAEFLLVGHCNSCIS
ncbi:MAG: transcriptional repressor [Bacteroidota bacterium]